jgi:DNA polymerase-4
MNRILYHIDIDAFFASVEQAKDPSLKGKPVIVGNGVIASCSYEARAFGLHAGMSIRTAERLCPEGIYLDGDQAEYSRVSSRMEEICRDCSPVAERVSIDELFLDMSGFQRIHPDIFKRASELAADIQEQTGVTVSIGIGDNRLIAKMAASFGKPAGITMILPGCGAEFIAPMDISELHGVGRKRKEFFRRMNIRTIRDLRLLPKRSLKNMFGLSGEYIADACRGMDAGIPEYGGLPSSISRETTFHTDTSDRQYATAMLWYLIERAASALRNHFLEARCLEVRIRYSDFKSARTSCRLTGYSCRDAELFRHAETMFHSIYQRRVTLRYIGVTLTRFRRASYDTQLLLFEPDPPPYRLYESVDRVREKYGYSALAGGRSISLMTKLQRNRNRGFTLRTPSLTQ